jgi:hypothetical protein
MRQPFAFLVALSLLAGGIAVPADAQQRLRENGQRQGPGQRGDQASAREEMSAGRTMPLREIERRIIPQMKGADYLGPEWDQSASAYRLKFMKEGQVTWVDVDARTGRVLRVSR